MPLTLTPEMWNGKRMFYFTDCPACGVGTSPANYVRGGANGSRAAKCAGCQQIVKVRMVQDTHKARAGERQKCGPKCEAATGPTCDCFCEGMNHGRCA